MRREGEVDDAVVTITEDGVEKEPIEELHQSVSEFIGALAKSLCIALE